MAKGKLYVISGPSGAGKGTICKEVLAKDSKLRLSVSMTTRKPREGELHGREYFFATRDEFEALIAKGGFIEYANVHDNYYGTPKKQMNQWMQEGYDVILEIDVQGGLQVKEQFPDSVLIFVLPPSMKILRKRLVARGTDAPEVIEKRMTNAIKELGLLSRYEHFVVNDKLDLAVDSVYSIISSSKED